MAQPEGSSSSINLLNVQRASSPVMQSGFRIMKNVAYGGLITLFFVSVLVGALSIALRLREEAYDTERNDLKKDIAAAIAKEGMITDIKVRVAAVDSILKQQKNPIPFIDAMLSITEGTTVTSLTIGENNDVTVGMILKNVSDAQTVVARIMKLVAAQTIRFPVLESFGIDDLGVIQMNISYKVVM